MTDYKHFPRVPRDNFVAEVMATISALVVMLLMIGLMVWAVIPEQQVVPLATDKESLRMYTADALARHTERTNAHFEAVARGGK